ncbi:hypothetical protein [Microbaculum marinum]|uniref:Uncharacterized protein n=1 Tax=Microbaculum marinum TaxID=1764581 RepID=A0AAW9RLU6_9HYPH
MTDASPRVAAVKFKWSDKTYDYFAPFPVEVGQKVIVETRRGETTVEIVEIKNGSDRAEKFLLRIAEPEPSEET